MVDRVYQFVNRFHKCGQAVDNQKQTTEKI